MKNKIFIIKQYILIILYKYYYNKSQKIFKNLDVSSAIKMMLYANEEVLK